MSGIAIVLIVIGALLVLFFIGGLLGARRRSEVHAGDYAQHLQEADHALEEARAADKGWDRSLLERAARAALERERPGFEATSLDIVLVDDRPGVTEDRAHLVASDGNDRLRVVLSRGEGGWAADSIDAE